MSRFRKSPWKDILMVYWFGEPQWRTELDVHYDEILKKTGLSDDELEEVVSVFKQYNILQEEMIP
jgi:hypothetical protein